MKEFSEVYENVSLKDCTTLAVGGKCKYLVKPSDEEELVKLLKYIKKNNLKYYILGNGSNVILDDKYFDGIIIKLDNLNNITIDDHTATAQGGVMLPRFVHLLLEHNYTNLAFAGMIPGTIGGSIVGNAGAYNDDLLSHVKSVRVLDEKFKIKDIDIKDIEYGYRFSSLKEKYIVLGATFNIQLGDSISVLADINEKNEKRRNTQPLDKRSVGSIFKNPENNSAGKLIDDLGLKGKQIGGAKISDKHANFIINEDNASFNDMIKLIDLVKKEVKENNNIDLQVEPVIVKWDKL